MQNLEKLKENRDFKRLYYRGKSCASAGFVMYFAKGRRDKVRLGITAGKKIGGAVQRNRAKRVITAAFRNCIKNIPSGYDFVIVARSKILEMKSTQVAFIIKKQLCGAGLWSNEETDK